MQDYCPFHLPPFCCSAPEEQESRRGSNSISDGAEVDLFVETRSGHVAVEIKAAREWQRRFGNGLWLLQGSMEPTRVRAFGVFRGSRRMEGDGVTVLPLLDFLRELWKGAIIA